jgi:hypothetical protein
MLRWRREEKKQAVNLQPAWTQEPRNFVKEISGVIILIVKN